MRGALFTVLLDHFPFPLERISPPFPGCEMRLRVSPMTKAGRAWDAFCLMALTVGSALLPSCRFGYEILGEGGASSVGGAGGAWAGDGGSNSPGGNDGNAGTGGGEGSNVDYHVTTGIDEEDVGATAAEPLGEGLSLREAILLANEEPGTQIISIQPGVVTRLSGSLPTISGSLLLLGGQTEVDASSAMTNRPCILVEAPVTLENLTIRGCPAEPVYVGAGSGSQIRTVRFIDNAKALTTSYPASRTRIGPDNEFIGSASDAVFLAGAEDQVFDSIIREPGGNGISVNTGGTNASIVGNLIVRALRGISFSAGADGANIWHNTIVSSMESGIATGQSAGLDVRNNILTHATNFGIAGDDADFSSLDHNLYFDNGLEDCEPCTVGPDAVLADPLYQNFQGDQFTLQTASPAIDAGQDTGADRNGVRAGLFDGSAPDLGFSENG